MVQRKPARKRKEPKCPDNVPAWGGDRGPGSRAGGGGMAPAQLPNYMRATSCSGAKAGAAQAHSAPQPQPGRASVARAPRAGRATCSSAMKGPGARACPYAFCSVKGHARAPPLRSFVAARRRGQQSMKLKGASPFGKPTVGWDASRSDVSAEGLGAASVGGSCASSGVVSVERSTTTRHRGREGEKTLVVEVADHECDDDLGAGESDISVELGANHGGNSTEGEVSRSASSIPTRPVHM